MDGAPQSDGLAERFAELSKTRPSDSNTSCSCLYTPSCKSLAPTMDPTAEGGPPKVPVDTVEVEVEVKQVCLRCYEVVRLSS